jgi:hypothetical protein
VRSRERSNRGMSTRSTPMPTIIAAPLRPLPGAPATLSRAALAPFDRETAPERRDVGESPLSRRPGAVSRTVRWARLYSTVTDFARLRGWSTSRPFAIDSAMA